MSNATLIAKYACYVSLLASYIALTKNTFRNIYKKVLRLSSGKSTSSGKYVPVHHHWFYQTSVDENTWKPFSRLDSFQLERACHAPNGTERVVPTEGGKYDVDIAHRRRKAVYWSGNISEVRRCSWFHRSSNEIHFTPFDEHIASILEFEYQYACESNDWYRLRNLPNGDSICFNGLDNYVFLSPQQWPHTRVLKRGVDDEFDITEDDTTEIDHLVFVVHGIGTVCDLKFRSIEEVVYVMQQKVSELLNNETFRNNDEKAKRVEVLPINWHKIIHNTNSKTDQALQSITLDSMHLFRNFTNNTLADILLYASTMYSQEDYVKNQKSSFKFSTPIPFGQVIRTAVATELNHIYDTFKQRNCNFNGAVSLLAHSLGSVVIFDLLCHQKPVELNILVEPIVTEHGISWHNYNTNKINRLSLDGNKRPIQCTQLKFQPKAFFAVGSPIGLFLTVRGINRLGMEFCLPTCKSFYIFHPCDPIAYRIEPLLNLEMEAIKPPLIPYCGTKYDYREIKDIMLTTGKNIKKNLIEYLTRKYFSLMDSVYMNFSSQNIRNRDSESVGSENRRDLYYYSGNLNKGRRVDYCLHVSSIRNLNEYICALTSHFCYWESPDVVQFILKELYETS